MLSFFKRAKPNKTGSRKQYRTCIQFESRTRNQHTNKLRCSVLLDKQPHKRLTNTRRETSPEFCVRKSSWTNLPLWDVLCARDRCDSPIPDLSQDPRVHCSALLPFSSTIWRKVLTASCRPTFRGDHAWLTVHVHVVSPRNSLTQ